MRLSRCLLPEFSPAVSLPGINSTRELAVVASKGLSVDFYNNPTS